MARKRQYTEDEIADAITQSEGMIASAAKLLNCDPSTIYLRMQTSERLQQLRDRFDLEQVNEAESMLRKLVRDGDRWAVGFTLKTKGAKHGYVEQRNLNIAGQENAPPVRIEFTKYEILDQLGGDES